MNRHFPLLCIVFFALAITAQSQPFYDKIAPEERNNFYAIQKHAYEYFKQVDTTKKGVGWKGFKRWEWFWKQRVDSLGNFPPADQLIREKQKFDTEHNDRKNNPEFQRKLNSNWTQLGPTTASGGYWGLGRLTSVLFHPADTNLIWVGSAGGGLWRSTNGGANWTAMTDQWGTLGIGDIAYNPSNPNIMYCATGDCDGWTNNFSIGVLKSTDGGTTWNTTGLSYGLTQAIRMGKMQVLSSNPDIIIVATSVGIQRSTNAGVSWANVQSGNFVDIEVKPSDPNTLYASGRSSTTVFYRSTNAGLTWTAVTSGLPTASLSRAEIAVTPANPNGVYVLIANSSSGFQGLYYSSNSGQSFTAKSTTPNILNSSVDGSGTGGQGDYDLSIAISPADSNLVMIGGVNVWRSTTAGVSWTIVGHWSGANGVNTVHADHHYFKYRTTTTTPTLFICNDGGLYRTYNNGTNWTWLSNTMSIMQFYRIATTKSGTDRVICGAQDNSSRLYNAGTWSETLGTGDGMDCEADPTNSNILYTASYYGAISRTSNGGTNWSSISTNTARGESGGWITPYTLALQNPAIIYAGYQNVWKSSNSGSTWTRISTFGNTSTLTVLETAPSDSNVIYCSFGGTHYRTLTGGSTWATMTLPNSRTITHFVIHPTDPQKVWATVSGYTAGQKVYYSTNAGSSWTNISGSLPNVAVNCGIYQPNSPNRIYVGTDIGVYYRDDNMNDWASYNTNLPLAIVNDLDIRTSTQMLRAGTYGRGLWESPLINDGNYLSPPNPISPANTAMIGAVSTTQIVWSAVASAATYSFQVSTTSLFTTISTQSTVSTTFSTISILPNQTYYWRVLAQNSTATVTSAYSSVFSFSTMQCTPTFTNQCGTSNDFINSVTFAGISNVGTGCNGQTNNYIYYNLQQATVERGSTYPISLSSGSQYAQKFAVFIDYNGNSSFNDSGELVALSTTSVFTFSTSITIPITAQLGTTRIRCIASYSEIPTSACINYTYGETEDYNIVINSGGTLSQPILNLPLASATDIPTSAILSWQAVSSATSYIVEISRSTSFTPSTSQNVSTTQATFSLPLGQTWYWRVRAFSTNANSPFSVIRSFTTTSPELAVPSIATPSDQSVNILTNAQLFSWTTTANALGYELQCSPSISFANGVVSVVSTTSSTTAASLSAAIQYYARVRAYNDATTSSWSPIRVFFTQSLSQSNVSAWFVTLSTFSSVMQPLSNGTQLLGPGDDNASVSTLLPFVESFGGADYSSFYVSTNGFLSFGTPNAGVPTLLSGFQPSIAAFMEDMYVNGNITWMTTGQPGSRIVTVEFNDVGTYSSTCRTTSYNAQIKLYENQNYVDIHYGTMTNVGGNCVTLGIGLVRPNASTFDARRVNTPLSAPTLDTLNAFNHTLSSLTGLSNTVLRFTEIVSSALTTPALISPANASIVVATNATLQWTSVTGASIYHVQAATENTFTNPLVFLASTTNNIIISGGILQQPTVFWRVRAVAPAATGNWSAVNSFSTSFPPVVPPVLISPATNATNVNTNVAFTWSSVTNASQYTMQISTNSSFQTLFFSATQPDTVFQMTGLAPNTMYWWRVNGSNSNTTGSFSIAQNFTTQNAVPPSPSRILLSVSANLRSSQPTTALITTVSSSGTALAVTQNTVFALTSSNPIITLIGTTQIIIPIGSSSAVFSFTPINTSTATTSTVFTVAAVSSPSITSSSQTVAVSAGLPLPPWSVYSNTGNYASCAIPTSASITIGNRPIDIGDGIGAFYTNSSSNSLQCAGFVLWNGNAQSLTIVGDNELTSSIKEGFIADEQIIWKVWNAQTSQELNVQVTYNQTPPLITTGTYQTNGLYALTSIQPVSNQTQIITLSTGWNLISSYIVPTSGAISSILGNISSLVIARDGFGNVFWPEFGINTILTWNPQRAYQIYTTSPASLNLTGQRIQSSTTPLQVTSGWNWIAYWRSNSMSAASALSSVSSSIVIARDIAGNVFWPSFGISALTMSPGYGYQAYFSTSGSIYYPASPRMNDVSHVLPSPKIFNLQGERSGEFATLGVYVPNGRNGDEIAVSRQNGEIVGSGVVEKNKAVITVWGKDAYSRFGAELNEKLSLSYRRQSAPSTTISPKVIALKDGLQPDTLNNTYILLHEDSNLLYKTNTLQIITLDISDNILENTLNAKLHPVPAHDEITCTFFDSSSKSAFIEILNVLGKVISSQRVTVIPSSENKVILSLKNCASGTYYCRITTESASVILPCEVVR